MSYVPSATTFVELENRTVDGEGFLALADPVPGAIDPDDVEFLQDLIVAAVNEGVKNVDAMVEKEMGQVTGGMNIPGLG